MTLRVLDPHYGGAFLTEQGGAPVRFVLPGESITLDPITILQPSPDRTTPGCRHFGTCGGCDYQHATYPAQLRLKQQILDQTLQPSGLDLPPIQTHAADPWHYRNRIRLRIETLDGTPHAGYNRRATRDFLPITECPIAAPILWRAAEALLTLTQTEAIAARWLPSLTEVEFHTNGSALQMTLFTRDARTEAFAPFCEALAAVLPELVGAGTLAATAGYGARERAQWGVAGLAHRVLDRTLWLTRGGFFQVNRFLLEELVTLVTANRRGALAWDLYAGVGLFSRPLAQSFDQVVAVESNPTAAADLARTPRKSAPILAVQSETAAFLARAVLDRARPDLVVLDPPRAGLGPDVCALLARIAPPEIVYVSCDPTTLARDLALLQPAGYRITQLHLVDLFPQTFHLETVVYLTPGVHRKSIDPEVRPSHHHGPL